MTGHTGSRTISTMNANHLTTFGAVLATGSIAALILGATALPVAADSLPAAGCVTDCVATFDTIGTGFEFDVPANITELSVSIGGGAGAPPAFAITNDPSAVGGAGGAATVDLGTEWAGETLFFGVGGAGGASSLQEPGGDLLVVAGGGGQGGYAGRLDLPGQIFATYPGGAGASPTFAGLSNGEDATAYGSDPANGDGGNDAAGGAGGTGDANGVAGSSLGSVNPTSFDAALGGAGGTLVVNEVQHSGGRGGDGITGGGGGAIAQYEVDENPVDLVAPGGGGSGLLAAPLTATENEPNTGTGYVIFTYSLSDPALPATGSDSTTSVLWAALALLGLGGAAILWMTRKRSA